VGCCLVHDLPSSVDAKQRVQVYPPVRQVVGIVETEKNRGNIASLSHRDNPSHDPLGRRCGPFLEGVSDETLVHSAVTVGEENPRIFVKGPLELVDIAVVKAVDVQLDNPNDVLAIRSSYPLGRRKKSQLMNPQCSRRPNGTFDDLFDLPITPNVE
jgi:hypothetical protein